MTWFRVGPSGIPASVKTGMNQVLNKKFGTSTDYPPTGWPDDVNLMGPLEEKTVSGAIASFSDGADDVPIKSLVCNIDANLTGISSVGVVQTGKNLIDTSSSAWETGAINSNTGANGTSNDHVRTKDFFPIKALQSFIMSGTSLTSGDNDGRIFYYDENHEYLGYINWRTTSVTPNYDNLAYFRMRFRNTVDLSALQVEYGNTATTYEAYHAETHTATLGRTIYGGSGDVVNGTGTETAGKAVFTGSETWRLYSDETFWYTTLAADNIKVQQNCTTSNGVIVRYQSTSGQLRVYISQNVGVVDTTTNMNALLSNGVSFAYPYETPEDFTFTPTPINSRLGDNNIWCDSGDSEIVYRSSGTETIIQPTLISKTVTENNTYRAEDDNADGYSEVTVNVAGTAVRIPTVLFVQSKNRGSANTFTYTFTEAGTFQYLVSMSGNSTPTTSNLTVSLNNDAITPSSFSNGDLGFFYGEITVAADDVLTVTTTADSNRGAQVFVFKDADVTNFSLVAWRGNDGGTFSIQTSANEPFLEVYKTGYYTTNNNFNYVIAMLSSNSAGMESIPTPANYGSYYYGFTYVITI